jgi:hypothetical protein
VSAYLIIFVMGLTAWYAWPAAPTVTTKLATAVFAVFLAPFSWPWLIARGYRARRHARWQSWLNQVGRNAVEGFTAGMQAAEKQRQENIAWWQNEWQQAGHEGDAERQRLASEVLAAMGANAPHW